MELKKKPYKPTSPGTKSGSVFKKPGQKASKRPGAKLDGNPVGKKKRAEKKPKPVGGHVLGQKREDAPAPKFYGRPGQSPERKVVQKKIRTKHDPAYDGTQRGTPRGDKPAKAGEARAEREEPGLNAGYTPGKPKAAHRKGAAQKIIAERKALPPPVRKEKPHSAKGGMGARNSFAHNAPRPVNYRVGFDELWTKLFSSPVHLDSALSKAPPSLKSSLAEITRLLLQRPRSLAHYLRFNMSDDEPWYLSKEALAEWPTARAMADRLFQAWKRDPYFNEAGRAQEQDYPDYMIEEWKRDFGHKVCEELVVSLAETAPLALRATRKKGRNEVLSSLNDGREVAIRGRASAVSPVGFYYDEYTAVMGNELFEQGDYEIQDEGSQVMALFALWPKEMLPMLRKVPGACREWPKNKELPPAREGITVIDACAGAGGKTLAMADALLGKSNVFAYDVSVKKLEALRRRATRSNLFNIKAVQVTENEEEKTVSKFRARADVLLVDAPCSGWGTLRRNPDVKWRQDYDSLDRLVALQARLLDAYSPLVKPGGTLTYGVCTFRKKETTDQVAAFLERHPDFESIGGGYLGPRPSDAFFLHAFRRKVKDKKEA